MTPGRLRTLPYPFAEPRHPAGGVRPVGVMRPAGVMRPTEVVRPTGVMRPAEVVRPAAGQCLARRSWYCPRQPTHCCFLGRSTRFRYCRVDHVPADVGCVLSARHLRSAHYLGAARRRWGPDLRCAVGRRAALRSSASRGAALRFAAPLDEAQPRFAGCRAPGCRRVRVYARVRWLGGRSHRDRDVHVADRDRNHHGCHPVRALAPSCRAPEPRRARARVPGCHAPDHRGGRRGCDNDLGHHCRRCGSGPAEHRAAAGGHAAPGWASPPRRWWAQDVSRTAISKAAPTLLPGPLRAEGVVPQARREPAWG